MHPKGKKARNLRDLTGQVFGRLTVISKAPSRVTPGGSTLAQWNCRCVCGQETIVLARNLITENTRSCGCYQTEVQSRGGPDGVNWKGGRWLNSKGYVMLYVRGTPDEKYQRFGGVYELEHVVLMSRHLGRRLLPEENVHHLNGERADNRIENLELWSSSQPCGQRVSDKVAWAKEIIMMYEPDWSGDGPRS